MPILLSAINTILQKEDVEGLIAQGAPHDEYAHEAKEIADAVMSLNQDQQTETNVVAIISLVWAKSFNRSAEEIKKRIPTFQHIAQQLLG